MPNNTFSTQQPFFATLDGSNSDTLTLNNCTSLTIYTVGDTCQVTSDTQIIYIPDGISLDMTPNSPYAFNEIVITPNASSITYVVYLL
jgi:hypothetical protein